MTIKDNWRTKYVDQALDELSRDDLIKAVAFKYCQRAYPGHSLGEMVSPKTELWMRLIPEATIAVEAVFDVLHHAGLAKIKELRG